MSADRTHGGCDALGVPQHDFSTNSNACGPCPVALATVQAANASHYPDASYTDLRARLADFHGVAQVRVLLAGSASEFIFRISAWVAQGQTARGEPMLCHAPAVSLPEHGYGDYRHAAQAWGLALATQPDHAQLVWACEPSSPLGQAHHDWPTDLMGPLVVHDSAYAPLRLSGRPSLNAAQRDQVWQLFSPNKALGLPGVRAAYVIAPCALQKSVQRQIEQKISGLNRLAPSWPLGAHGVSLLHAWASPPVQAWLAQCLPTLRVWKSRQMTLLENLGWQLQPSEANFFCAKPPQPLDLVALRAVHGIKLRDCASFGLPGWLRLGVLGPQAQAALAQALASLSQPAGVSI